MKKLLLLLSSLVLWTSESSAETLMQMELKGLTHMKGQHYEGWNIINGQAVTTGRFSIGKDNNVYSVDDDGVRQGLLGNTDAAVFRLDDSHKRSSLFVLTIEPNQDKDPKPSDVHIIGGNYSNQVATLSVSHGTSLGTDFASASGEFILAAPTGGNFNQGVWFTGLNLPSLPPKGWAYEGWIVNTKNGGKISTGVFRDAKQTDSNKAGRFAGSMVLDFPNVPGEDIVKTPIVLNDDKHAIVVTVEPYPDFDPSPYNLKILKTDVSSSAEGMTGISLTNIVNQNTVSGRIVLK